MKLWRSARRFLCMLLAALLILSAVAVPAFAADSYTVVSGVGKKAANTSNTSNQYSKYWQYWSQGASKYNLLRKYGCRLVAHAKLLVECGAASGDTAKFNPDVYYEWAIDKGYWKPHSSGNISELKTPGLAAAAYATAHGVSLTRKGSVKLSGSNSADDAKKVMDYVKNGYYVILSCSAHQAYVGRDASLKAGVPIILDSWSSWSYHQSQCSKYNSKYQYAKYTAFIYFEKDGETPPPSNTVTIGNLKAKDITETNAYLSATVSKTKGTYVDTCGIWLGTNKDELKKQNTETVGSAANNKDNGTSFDIFYDLTKELKITLNPGVTYYYKFYCTVGDKTYYSDVASFKTSGVCTHTWNSGTVTVDPTCTATGERTYTCTKCGAKKTESIDALWHDYKRAVTAPTCTEKGFTLFTCSRCGDSYKSDYVNALGHDYKNGVCTRCGKKDPDYKPTETEIPGDVDGSGEVDTIDSIRLAKYLVDLVELTEAQKKAADVNGDGDVTALDGIRLAKYLVGLVETLRQEPARAASRAQM